MLFILFTNSTRLPTHKISIIIKIYKSLLYYAIFAFYISILHSIFWYIILINKCKLDFAILKHCQFYILNLFKLHLEDGFMKAETCRCYVLLIKYILYNKFVLVYKHIYIYINNYLKHNGVALNENTRSQSSLIQGDSVARGPKLLSIKNYVMEITTWKFIYTYRERCKTGPAHNRRWNWSPFTSKHTWMRFCKFWNTSPKVSTLTAWISWRIASLSCSIVRCGFLYTLPFNRPPEKGVGRR